MNSRCGLVLSQVSKIETWGTHRFGAQASTLALIHVQQAYKPRRWKIAMACSNSGREGGWTFSSL